MGVPYQELCSSDGHFVLFLRFVRPAATYSANTGLGVSTIGPGDLNCRVRNGNGCNLSGITTGLTNHRKSAYLKAKTNNHTLFYMPKLRIRK